MTAEKEAKGGSVLAGLVADTMSDKTKAAGRKLTPVESELRPSVRVPDVPGDFLTDEGLAMTARDLRSFAKDLRRQADGLEKVADGIDKMRGQEPEAETAPAVDQKQREFEADLRAKERAAQEATFKSAEGASPVSEVPEAGATDETAPDDRNRQPDPASWKCPTHGKSIEKVSSRSGMKFIGCPDCNLFERK